MNNKERLNKGKKLSFLLRHDTNYKFDEHGWRTVKDLEDNYGYTLEMLEELVETNDKKRYEFNNDKTAIRARQGHSINVDVELKEETPPDILYHGSALDFFECIKLQGIEKMGRLHVHLTENKDTAINTGKRYGIPLVYTIDSKQMHIDNIKFYHSNNNVWLTDYVDPKYIISVK